MPTTPAPPFQTIAIITGGDLVGDGLLKLPFLRALRRAFPEAAIHYIAEGKPTAFAGPLRPYSADLIDHAYEVQNWPQPGTPGIPSSFDLIIDTRGDGRKAREAKKVPHKLFLASAKRFLFSERRPSLFSRKPPHLTDRLLRFVKLAAGYLPASAGALPIPEDLLEKARRILPEGKIYVGLAPGCSTPARQWPLECFIELAKAQIAKARVPVFILGPMEADWHEALRAQIPSAKFPLQDFAAWGVRELALAHSFALGRFLALLVANDSGPGHIFAAAGCPVVSLFGPTKPEKASPRSPGGAAIRARDFGSAKIEAIPLKTVDNAVDKLLSTMGSKAANRQ
ncbi:MAG TPA: glycosyltransferase family 9 protein [Alphaproteobacteria bacterium]|nr:glycosyltransferase family 9 protein [Alphaproteobacteria bacterium]